MKIRENKHLRVKEKVNVFMISKFKMLLFGVLYLEMKKM